MEIASEKRMIAATNLKLKVEYDYSVSRSSYHSSVPGASQRIPICTLPYQNCRTTQGLQVNILVKMGFGIKFLLLFLAWGFYFPISVADPTAFPLLENGRLSVKTYSI